MSAEERDNGSAAGAADVLGPPPADFDMAAAAPSGVLETILLRFLARVIHADGVVHPQEMSMLLEIALKLNLEGGEAKRILEDEFNRESDCAALAAQLPDPARRREAYAMGCLMCLADGDVHDNERQVLADFARGAEIPHDRAEVMFEKLIKVAEAAKAKAQSSQ